MDIPRLVFGG